MSIMRRSLEDDLLNSTIHYASASEWKHRSCFLSRDRLHSVSGRPQLSASIGISIYNGDGERIEKILSDADAQFYAEKARRHKQYHLSLIPRGRAQKA